MTSGRPFLGALNLALCKLYCNQVNGEDSTKTKALLVERITQIFFFVSAIGHKFDEQVPQERVYSSYSSEYEVNRRNQVEAIYHNRRNMMNEIYGQAKGEAAEELGIVDLKALEDRETNFFVHYNWLHFLVQIVLLL